jgi:hypothetical protein
VAWFFENDDDLPPPDASTANSAPRVQVPTPAPPPPLPSPSAPPQAPSPPPPCTSPPLATGARVRVNGLSGRSELNGSLGTVVSWDDRRGRHGVRLDGSSQKPLAMRVANLVVVAPNLLTPREVGVGSVSSLEAADGPPPALKELGVALAHGATREMRLALQCACMLGPGPWRLPHAVSVHRIVGRKRSLSTVVRGAMVSLGRIERTVAVSILSSRPVGPAPSARRPGVSTPPTSPVVDLSSLGLDVVDGGGGDAAAGLSSGVARHDHDRSSCVIETVLVDGDLLVPGTSASHDAAEMRATSFRAGAESLTTLHTLGRGSGPAPLASSLRRAGLRLVLVRGAVDVALRSCCADEGVLVVPNVAISQMQALCAATQARPIRDGAALAAAVGRAGRPLAGVRLSCRVVECGVRPPSEEGTIARRGADERSAASSIEDTYLLVHPTVAGGGGVALLACGATEDLAKETERRCLACLCRLHAALRDGRVLPGGGAAELACAAALESEADKAAAAAATAAAAVAPATVSPAAPGSSGVPTAQDGGRRTPAGPTALHASASLMKRLQSDALYLVGASLRGLTERVLLNCGVTADAAALRIHECMQSWRALPFAQAAALCREPSGAIRRDVAWSPLVDAAHFPSGASARMPGGAAEAGPLDPFAPKLALLHASVDVLEQLLLADVLVNMRPSKSV